MRCTQYYFSYCSLQNEDKQEKILGRKLIGKKDTLPGYKVIKKNSADPSVAKSEEIDEEVSGILYNVSYRDIFDLDEYKKQFNSKRIKTTLKSGAMAWVHIDN